MEEMVKGCVDDYFAKLEDNPDLNLEEFAQYEGANIGDCYGAEATQQIQSGIEERIVNESV